MLGYLLCSRVALAQDIIITEMEELYRELIPKVEAAAGRSFIRPPQLVLSDLDIYTRRFIENLTDELVLKGFSESDVAAAASHLRDSGRILPDALAIFDPWDDRIHLMEDQIEEMVTLPFVTEAWRLPLVECTLAHELTHALQHEAGLFGDEQISLTGPARSAVMTHLIEGHAESVASAICPPAARGFQDLMLGSPWLWEWRNKASLLSYVVAEQYIRDNADTAEEAWALLDTPEAADLDAIIATHEEEARLVAEQATALARAFESSLTFPVRRHRAEVISILGTLDGDGYARAGTLRSAQAWAVPYSTYGFDGGGTWAGMGVTVAVLRFDSVASVEALMAEVAARWGGSRSKRTGIYAFRYDRERHEDSAWSNDVMETYYWLRDGQSLISVCVSRAPLSKGFVKRTLLGVLAE